MLTDDQVGKSIHRIEGFHDLSPGRVPPWSGSGDTTSTWRWPEEWRPVGLRWVRARGSLFDTVLYSIAWRKRTVKIYFGTDWYRYSVAWNAERQVTTESPLIERAFFVWDSARQSQDPVIAAYWV